MKHTALLPIIILSLVTPTVIANTDSKDTSKSSVTMNKTETQGANAVDLIQQDHDYIRNTIKQLDKNLDSNVAESRSIFKTLKEFLVKHETMEQKIWYPALEKKDPDLDKIISDLKKQEKDAGHAIDEIEKIKDDKEWASKVKTFTKDVDNHAKNEENNLFPKVKKAIAQSELEDIGKKLEEYKVKNNMNNKS